MDKKFLCDEEIKKELDDYLYNTNIKYATLLNGAWGCGKTFFVKDYINELEKLYSNNIKNKESKYKKPIYISLYGISSISDIKHKITLSLIKNKKIKQLLPFLDVGLELGSEFISKNTFIQNSDSKINKIFNTFYKIDNLIIFFDDLERCNLNINSILGYINELVEHHNIKVIIIADEEKIGKANYENNLELKYMVSLSNNIKLEEKKPSHYSWNDNKTKSTSELTKNELLRKTKYIFNEDAIYNEIKEKLIGKIVCYRANVGKLYDIFANKIVTNKEAKKTVIKNKLQFLEQLNKSEHYNLRTIQFVFQSFNRLTSETINIIALKEIENIYLDNLFLYCSIKSFQIKKGEYSYNWKETQEFGTIYLGNEIDDYISSHYVDGFKFVDDYLLNSYIDKKNLKFILEQYKKVSLNELNNPNDPLYKLKTWWIIPENELNIILEDLVKRINNNEYDLELYSKIVNFLSRIEEMGICKNKIKSSIIGLEVNIEKGRVKGSYSEDRLFDGTKVTADLYQKNIKKIKLLIDNKNQNDMKKTIDEIFNDDNWGEKLNKYCHKNDGKFLGEKRFAYILDLNQIIYNIKNKNIEQIYEFWYALQKIYNFSNINEYYKDDKDKLTQLKDKLSDKDMEKIDKVKLFVVKKITNFLLDVIDRLE